MTALILTYHAIEPGPPPLCVEPTLFCGHLDAIAESGATALTVGGLAGRLRAGQLPDRCVAITFDDGFASVAREAGPLLAERGLRATVFCVAGHLGETNDWPTQPPAAPRRALASATELAELAAAGHEIGSHGTRHDPLAGASEGVLRRELVDSKRALEEAIGVSVTSFAFPYGGRSGSGARDLLERSYTAACTGGPGYVASDADPLALARVDVHYLRAPELLRRALAGSAGPYLRARRLGARARRMLRKDYVDAVGR